MPPQKENQACRYDDSEFKRRVQEHLWESDNSLTSRVKLLEQRVENQRFWTPILFGAFSTGLFVLLQIIWDVVQK